MSGGVFDVASIEAKIAEKEELSGSAGFWDEPKKAEKVLSDIKMLRNRIEPWKELIKTIDDIEATYELAEESGDEELSLEVEKSYTDAKEKYGVPAVERSARTSFPDGK